MCARREKLGWTCERGGRFVVSMDQDEAMLLALLYTRIGILMEDASIIALTLGGTRGDRSRDELGQLEKAIAQIAQFMKTASLLAD